MRTLPPRYPDSAATGAAALPRRRALLFVGALTAATLALCPRQAPARPAGPPPRVISPANDGTIHDNTGRVPVIVADLPARWRLRVLLDGAPVGELVDPPAFELEGIDRGTHHLVLVYIDEQGQERGRSEEVTFHVWQASPLFRPARP